MKNFTELYDHTYYTNFELLKNNYSKLIKIFMLYGKLNSEGYGELKKTNIPNEYLYIYNDNFQNGIGSGLRPLSREYGIKYCKNHSSSLSFLGIQIPENRPNIPLNVRRLIKNKPCAIIHSNSDLEIDHKYRYSLYENDLFKNNENNYQPLNRSLNSKKREVYKERNKTRLKSNNILVNCAFATSKNNLKYEEEKYTTDNPFDGDFWTDPKETHKLDRRHYTEYFLRFRDKINDLDYNLFENFIIPIINKCLINDFINIEDYDVMVNNVMNYKKNEEI